MSSIPLADAPRLAGAARRTTAVRTALALVVLGSVLSALQHSRHPNTHALVPLAGKGNTIVVLDLSASISTDTYSQIGATLSGLARSNGKLGLILFSDQAYEALPQGTPASDLTPLVRLFTLPQAPQAGFAPTLPPNPWTASFSGGTKISAGLTLAHTLAVASGGPRPTVVLISDLSDDPRDLTRLASILLAYRRDGVPVRIVGLNPAPADVALFRRSLPPATDGGAGADARQRNAGHPHALPVGARPVRARGLRRAGSGGGLGAAARMGKRVTAKLLAAAGLLALAVLAFLLAADARSWNSSLNGGDIVYADSPGAATWTPHTRVGRSRRLSTRNERRPVAPPRPPPLPARRRDPPEARQRDPGSNDACRCARRARRLRREGRECERGAGADAARCAHLRRERCRRRAGPDRQRDRGSH